METLDKQTVELNSDCVCAEEDGTPASDCWGCWDDSVFDMLTLMETWEKANNLLGTDYLVKIDGRAMTWLRRDGYAVVEPTKELDALKINGDFRLVFTLEGKDLKCVRYSHDEPTGAYFTFSSVPRD